MPDNITTPAIGTVLATKDIGGVHYPRSLLTDAAGADIGDDNPLPVALVGGGLTDDELRAAPVPVEGDFYPATQPVSAVALPLPAGAATAANQDEAIAALDASAPADDLFAITPSDTVALTTLPKALLVTVAGNVAIRGTGANPVTIPVTAGQILPIRARYVYATGTTATVVGLI